MSTRKKTTTADEPIAVNHGGILMTYTRSGVRYRKMAEGAS